ncbi:protein sel-1 1 [Podospora conica]|nr:protein sel-1 1 [Schizothecium conicum]
MRQHLVWLFLLLQAVAFSHAETQARQDGTQKILSSDPTDAPREGGADIVTADGGPRPPGADLVDSALIELRKIHQPLRHRSPKSQNIFTTLLQLAWKALPTLRLSAPMPESPQNPLHGGLLHATNLLKESAAQNNSDALYILAEMNFYGNYSHPRDFHASFNYYHTLASLNGNASAQHMVGLMYSTGVGGAVERDQARALLYYTFAANQGHTRAEMAVAHRHHAGIGVPKNCENAVKYYKRVADKAMAWVRAGPPGGMSWVSESYRIADETGGVYGEGASVASTGTLSMKGNAASDAAYASIEDIIEYLDLMSQKGDFKASYNLGRLYYEGQRGLPKDHELAAQYFFAVTRKFWKQKGGRIADNYKAGLDKVACKAAGYLGRMYMRGEGVSQSFVSARIWFERGISHADPQSNWGLGLLHLHGYGVDKNIGKAITHFNAAVEHESTYAPALVQLGALYLDQGTPEDIAVAHHYFELASRQSSLESYYYIGEMAFFGVGREKSCSAAISYYKSVSERTEPLVSSWAEANLAYADGDVELAFLEYLGAAEQGYERAQNNVAHLLDPEQSRLPIPEWLYPKAQKPPTLQNPSLALIYWTRSARQGNIDSYVKMGDYFLNGIGATADVDKAVQCYTQASEYHQSAQALYNLGWMHENGLGLNQDYHLAKRYYDQALETNEEAYLPVTLSLLKLRARSAWNTLTHGAINSIQDDATPKKEWSLSEWITNFMQDDGGGYYDDDYDLEYDDTMPGGDPGMGEVDDGIFESLAIVGLVGALVFLILYRQQRQQQAARQQAEQAERQQRQQQQGGGHAGGQDPGQQAGGPQPGDFRQWGAAAVGH